MPLEIRTGWRTRVEVAGLVLGAYLLDRVGENAHLTIAVTNGIGLAWSVQGGSTLTKRRVHAISLVMMQVSMMSGMGDLAWNLGEMPLLQRVRLAAGIGSMSLDTVRIAGDLWNEERYAVARHKVLADGSFWGWRSRSSFAANIHRGVDGFDIEVFSALTSMAEKQSHIDNYLRHCLLTDNEIIDAMFATASTDGKGTEVPCSFWKERLTEEQLKIALRRTQPPILTETQRKALSLINENFNKTVAELNDDEKSLVADADLVKKLYEGMELAHSSDRMDINVRNIMEVLTENRSLIEKFDERIRERSERLKQVDENSAQKVRRLYGMVYRREEAEGDEVEDQSAACFLFCAALERFDQNYVQDDVVDALGLERGYDEEAFYRRFYEIGLHTNEAIEGIMGETIDITLANVKKKANVPYYYSTPSWLPTEPVVMELLGWMAVGDLLLRSASERRVWAFAGAFWGFHMAYEARSTLWGIGEVDDVLAHHFSISTIGLVGLDVFLRQTGWMGTAVVWGGAGYVMGNLWLEDFEVADE